MIIDQTANFKEYVSLHPRFRRACDYLLGMDLAGIPVGRYEIDGENIYAMVQEYQTRPHAQGFWEAHRRYIDLQVVIQGAEKVGYANIKRLSQGEYDPARDFLALFGEGDFFTLKEVDFALFLPQDAHMPGLAVEASAPIKKIVIKIAVS